MRKPEIAVVVGVGPGLGSALTRRLAHAGMTGTSGAVAITVDAAPSVSLTSPASGATFTAPATINLVASAADTVGTLTKVDFYQGSTLIGTATTAPYSFSLTNVAAGSYTLTAVATDNQGATTTSSAVSISVVPNTPPTISLTTPANGASFKAPATITLTANAQDSDGTVAKVDFYQGTTLLSTVTTAPYTFTVNSLTQGSYTFTAVATDDKGASTTSNAATITVTPAQAQVFYIYTDQLNTPRTITDTNNAIVWRWDNTDPFGANVPDDDPNSTGNHFAFNPRFPGQYVDRESGTNYNYFRDYSPAIGRYVESDPIGLIGGLNTYTYVGSNPLIRIDPRGKIGIVGIVAIGAGVTGLITGTISAANGGSFFGGFITGAGFVVVGTAVAIAGVTIGPGLVIEGGSILQTSLGLLSGLGFDLVFNAIKIAPIISNASGAQFPPQSPGQCP